MKADMAKVTPKASLKVVSLLRADRILDDWTRCLSFKISTRSIPYLDAT